MSIPTSEDLIQTARDMAPAMAERATRCEELGQLPDDTYEDFRQAGFYRIVQPKAFGGYEMDLMTLFDVSKEIARGGCASSAWVLSILAIHNYYLGFFDPKAQQDIWGEDDNNQTCTPFNPSGTVTKVAGGIEVKGGRWAFASGCDHSAFALIGVLIDHQDGNPPEFCQCVVPRGEYNIDQDSWNVAGLRGSGSKDLTVDEIFVPQHRIFSLSKVTQGYAPGREINTGTLYKQSFFPPSINSLVAPACGAALHALDTFEEKMKSRTLVFGAGDQIEKVPSLIRLVEAESEIDMAEMLIKRDSLELMKLASRGETASQQLLARTLHSNAYGSDVFTRAVDRLFDASGGGALQNDHPMQRAWRDVHTINNHGGLNFDTTAELYGKVRMGLPSGSALLG
ncbi:MAG: acyl-CoA dehydrogenase family protein [Immundisolibacteraceae bacterium]|nr:acyl-CoA dehydrogenase family protein [Immundisolibacteraceae bacterium]